MTFISNVTVTLPLLFLYCFFFCKTSFYFIYFLSLQLKNTHKQENVFTLFPYIFYLLLFFLQHIKQQHTNSLSSLCLLPLLLLFYLSFTTNIVASSVAQSCCRRRRCRGLCVVVV